MEQGKRFYALKKTFRRFFGNKENTTIIYLNGNLTIVESQFPNYNNTNNTMIINGNIYNCCILADFQNFLVGQKVRAKIEHFLQTSAIH